jgi:hypothetical protein
LLENLPLVLAFLLIALGTRLTEAKSLQALLFLTVNLGFFFWYWIPSIQVVNFPPPSLLSSFTLRDDMVREATWVVLLYHFLSVATLIAARPLFAQRPKNFDVQLSFGTMAWAIIGSTFGLFVIRFATEGSGVLLDILSGRASSREFLTYYNISEGATQSLLALWDIANIAVSVYLIAYAVNQSKLLSFHGALAAFALVLSFLGSGTRSILVLGIFAVMAGFLFRPTQDQMAQRRQSALSGLRYIYLTFLGGVIGLASTGIVARFTVFRNEEGDFLSNTLFNNNDMFRELVFIKTYMINYAPRELGREVYNFFQTPFSFILPRFLGFDKEIPDHLITFNQIRANIDLLSGQGNVFPGLIGDFHMLFGVMGPLMFAVFILAFGVVIRAVSGWIPSQAAAMAFWVTMCANLLISFRNISGSLALIALLLLAVIWMWINVVPRRRVAMA